MRLTKLYETIFSRRSVRRYDKTPLSDEELAEIRRILDSVKQLPGQTARFEIANADQLKGVAAPHAILAYSPDDDISLSNIGYSLQTADLWLQASGYGSLWMGMGRPTESSTDYRILLAFGKTDAPLRKDESEFKRKPVLEIGNEDNAIARAARLAPSASNGQPWKLDFSPGKIIVRYNGKGIAKLFASKWQKIDVGIILKHAQLALENEGREITAITPKSEAKSFEIALEYR
jgi:nitroreductase